MLALGLIAFIAFVGGCGSGNTGESNLPATRTAEQITKGRAEFAAQRAAARAKEGRRSVAPQKAP
jgi:hypothetical protein